MYPVKTPKPRHLVKGNGTRHHKPLQPPGSPLNPFAHEEPEDSGKVQARIAAHPGTWSRARMAARWNYIFHSDHPRVTKEWMPGRGILLGISKPEPFKNHPFDLNLQDWEEFKDSSQNRGLA